VDTNGNNTFTNIANACQETTIHFDLAMITKQYKGTTLPVSTRNLRSRPRKFISAGEPGACIFHHRPILGFSVHKCERYFAHRIGFVSISINLH
jgi:hypothetical protein